MMYKVIFVIFICNMFIRSTFATPDNPDSHKCDFVAEHLDYMDLEGCSFISPNNFTCTLYANATDVTVLFPVSVVIEFSNEFYVINKSNIMFKDSNISEDWWCLGMSSMRFKKISEQPFNAENVYKLPSASAGLLSTIIESTGYFQFYAPVVAGFMQLKNDSCILENQNDKSDCIYRFRGVKMVVAPLSVGEIVNNKTSQKLEENNDGNLQWPSLHERFFWDFIQRQLLRFYVELMKGVLRTFTLSTSLQGPFSANWIVYLRGTHCQTLNASNNNFDYITFKHFMKMVNLTRLYLSNCKIKASDAVNFIKVPSLEVLDLSDNMFETPPLNIHLKNISTLDIGVKKNKPLKFTMNHELGLMIDLINLNLTGLPIIDIPPYSLPATLKILDISNCGLQNITEKTFLKLTNLTELYASHNNFTTLPSNVFFKLFNNAKIFLSYNQINTSKNLNFGLVDILDLSYNKLNRTNAIVISSGNIQTLDISGNHIRYWTYDDLFYNNFTNITNLNISNNEIASIDKIMGKSLNFLDTVDIGGNPFDCQDCALLEFQKWLNTTAVNILVLRKRNESILCSEPARQKDRILISEAYNTTECVIYPPNLLLVAVLPTCTVITISIVIVLTMYFYRFEITYIRHMLSTRFGNAVERDGCKYDVFVSYCSMDRDWVYKELVPALENQEDRYTLCLHERDFKLGSVIMNNIIECIHLSRRVILVLTNNFINSKWCKSELEIAQLRVFYNKNLSFLILVELERLERDSVPAHLRMLMDSRTYLEWSGEENSQNFWCRLKEALGTPIELAINNDELDILSEEEYLEQPLVPFQPLRI